jgi:transposase
VAEIWRKLQITEGTFYRWAEVLGLRTSERRGEEFEPSAQTIRNWVKQADLDEGVRSDGLTSSEREELRRLRREVKQLKVDREIPEKAAA